MPRQARCAPSAALLPLLLLLVAPMAAAMRAVVPEDGKCVVTEGNVPQPGGDELLVRVYGTAVNRADTLQRRFVRRLVPGGAPFHATDAAARKGPRPAPPPSWGSRWRVPSSALVPIAPAASSPATVSWVYVA